MNKITLILCAEDTTSVQVYTIRSHKSVAEITSYGGMRLGLPEGFTLIAAVEGWPDLKVKDDARSAEWGVE